MHRHWRRVGARGRVTDRGAPRGRGYHRAMEPTRPRPDDYDLARWTAAPPEDTMRPRCRCSGWCGRGWCGHRVIGRYEDVPHACGAPYALVCVATKYAGPGRSDWIVQLDWAADRYAHQDENDAFMRAANRGDELREATYARYLLGLEIQRVEAQPAHERDRFARQVLVSTLAAALAPLQRRALAHDARIAELEVADGARIDALYQQRKVDLARWVEEARVVAPLRTPGTFWATCSVPERVDLRWTWVGDPEKDPDRSFVGWQPVCQWCRRARSWHEMATGGLRDIETRHVESQF